jgi:uroporphyrinogen decarboxylase
MSLTHRERLQACLADDSALDRPPVALWRHFPVDDQSPEALAAATLNFQRNYDFDLVKVTPASSFCLKDWGAEDAWEGNPEGTRRYVQRVIEHPRDWETLPVLNPRKVPYLSGHLACLQLIRANLPAETPLLQTVFSPLAQAKNLVGGARLIVHLRQYPEAVMKGLVTIAKTTRRFVEACMKIGIDGVFYAVQHAQSDLLTLDEYYKFSLPLDLSILEPARSLWCNLLHLHGEHIYFDLAEKFDLPIVNWHDRQASPSLAEAKKKFGRVVCGGIDQNSMVFGNRLAVWTQAEAAFQQTGGRRFILGAGCVVPVIAPHGNLLAVRQSVERQA